MESSSGFRAERAREPVCVALRIRGRLSVPPERVCMRALSAAEAISPAINRTREFLFAPPFRWATFLKLCLVAVITEGLGTNLQSNANKHHASSGGPGPIAYNFSP